MTEHAAPKDAKDAKEPAAPLPDGPYGKFLKEHGINSKRHPDSKGVSGAVENIEIDRADLISALKFLRQDPEVGLDYLVAVSGVDNLNSFDSVYHLWSFTSASELVVKICAAREEAADNKLVPVPSITNFWPAANWHERESYDLVGIRYVGHPYLRRILNPWDWDGHPLRRDYKQPVDALNDKNPHSFR
ncbi:MAG TPA: NADH-quinone oxidoreductase subunit C [Oculatellaceae cyanobacterium]